MRYLRISFIPALFSIVASAQGGSGTSSFENATITPSHAPYWADERIPSIDTGPGATLAFGNISLRTLLSIAFGVSAQQVFGPEWMSRYYFDVTASVPRTADSAETRDMLQRLLEEHFGLEAVHDADVIRVLALQVAQQGPKLHSSGSAASEGSGCIRSFDPKTRNIKAVCHGINGARIAEQIQILAERQLLGRPVTNATGLDGFYDFSLSWTASSDGNTNDSSQTIYEAVNSQLGLKLVAHKRIADIVLIEQIHR